MENIFAVFLNIPDIFHLFGDNLPVSQIAVLFQLIAEAGFRVEADVRNEKLGFKVREAQLQKIPYILVVGDKEVEAGGINVRLRSGENVGLRSLSELTEMMRADCREPFKRGGMRYNFAYSE